MTVQGAGGAPRLKSTNLSARELERLALGGRRGGTTTNLETGEQITIAEERPETVIARYLSNLADVTGQNATYEGLRTGTAPWFDYQEGLKNLSPSDRSYTDFEIISLLGKDEEGSPLQFDLGFTEGLQRGALGGTGILAGTIAGGKTGARIGTQAARVIPHPLGKAAAPVVGGAIGAITGGITGFMGGEAATEQIMGPEAPIIPGVGRAEYEAGKTVAWNLPSALLPYGIGNKIQPNLTNLVDNLSEIGVKPDLNIGLASWLQRNTVQLGRAARQKPLAVGVVEAGAVGGMGLGAYSAETVAPADPAARLASEFAFGLLGSLASSSIATPVISAGSGLRSIGQEISRDPALSFSDPASYATSISRLVQRMLNPLEENARRSAARSLKDSLLQQGESPEAVAALLGARSTLPVEVVETSATRGRSPTLQAIETQLRQIDDELNSKLGGNARKIIARKANILRDLFSSEDYQDLQRAGTLASTTFRVGLEEQMGSAADRVLRAAEQVAPDGTVLNNRELGLAMSRTMDGILSRARTSEENLYRNIPSIPIPAFYIADGTVSPEPTVLSVFDEVMEPFLENAGSEAAFERALGSKGLVRDLDQLRKDLGPVPADMSSDNVPRIRSTLAGIRTREANMVRDENPFVGRADRFILENEGLSNAEMAAALREESDRILAQTSRRENTPQAKYGQLLERKAVLYSLRAENEAQQAAITVPITTKRLQTLRSTALATARAESQPGGDDRIAKQAYRIAEAARRDLENFAQYSTDPQAQNFRVALTAANAYTRALHDAFSRNFALRGSRNKTPEGDLVTPPELYVRNLRSTDNDVNAVYYAELDRVHNYATEKGLIDPEARTIKQMYLNILRNGARETMDADGMPNRAKYESWLNNNRDVLEFFPELKLELSDYDKALRLFDENSRVVENMRREAEDELNFLQIGLPLRVGEGTEDPAGLVHKILTEPTTRARRLNDLVARIDQTKIFDPSRPNFNPENYPPQLLDATPSEIESYNEAFRESARRGLASALFESVWKRSNVEDNAVTGFSPTKYNRLLFTPLREITEFGGFGGTGTMETSLIDWMVESNLITRAEKVNAEEALAAMVPYEVAAKMGDLDALMVEGQMGPMMSFYLSALGSAAGSRAYEIFGGTGPGQLAAAGAGAKYMRDLANALPAITNEQVMRRFMLDPEFLSVWLKKSDKELEQRSFFRAATEYLGQTGLGHIRRSVPVGTEIGLGFNRPMSEEEFRELTQERLAERRRAPRAARQESMRQRIQRASPQPAPAPEIPQIPVTAPQPAARPPLASVDPGRYQMLFGPNDPNMDIVQQRSGQQGGIGSLFG